MENKKFLKRIEENAQESHILQPIQTSRQQLIHEAEIMPIPQKSYRNTTNSNLKLPPQHQLKDLDKWDTSQIRSIFQFYDAHGPQWKNMSLEMPWRTANNLKNKFYTILRNIIKLLMRKNSGLCPRITGQISSKDLCRLYDGREKYEKYVGFIKDLLRRLDYDLENREIDDFVMINAQTIRTIYLTIYQDRIVSDDLGHGINRVSAINADNQIQNSNEIQNPVTDQKDEYQGGDQNISWLNGPQNFYMIWIPNACFNWLDHTY